MVSGDESYKGVVLAQLHDYTLLRGRAGAARLAHNQEVEGSSPSPATNKEASMQVISEAEYQQRKTAWKKEQWDREHDKPNGMISCWGWNLRKDREFKKMLSQQGITISN